VTPFEHLKIVLQQLKMTNKLFNNLEEEVKKKPVFFAGVCSIKEDVTLQEIMDEQNYKPCSYEEFRALADQIDWGNLTLDEMLEAIK